jgi:hypothetical protein
MFILWNVGDFPGNYQASDSVLLHTIFLIFFLTFWCISISYFSLFSILNKK